MTSRLTTGRRAGQSLLRYEPRWRSSAPACSATRAALPRRLDTSIGSMSWTGCFRRFSLRGGVANTRRSRVADTCASSGRWASRWRRSRASSGCRSRKRRRTSRSRAACGAHKPHAHGPGSRRSRRGGRLWRRHHDSGPSHVARPASAAARVVGVPRQAWSETRRREGGSRTRRSFETLRAVPPGGASRLRTGECDTRRGAGCEGSYAS
jgi:hypothetical protein